MILSRAPFRVSFVGGGSDLPAFYRHHPGAVLATTIRKYMYIMIHPYFHKKIRLKYSKTEDVDTIDQVEHPLIREALRKVGIESGVEIASIADVPAGTGLGSSSTFVVALLQALYAYRGVDVSKERLAAEACEIEIDVLKEPIGKQDQYAASFGGLQFIEFSPDESVRRTPLMLPPDVLEALQKRLLLFYIGNHRSASQILGRQKDQTERSEATRNALKSMVKLAFDLRECLQKGALESVGEILHEGWQLKKTLTTGIIDRRGKEFKVDGCFHKIKMGVTTGNN